HPAQPTPALSHTTFEDWEGDYEQVRFVIEHWSPPLIASFLRNHAAVLVRLARALDAVDTRDWHLVWVRKGRVRPRESGKDDPRELGAKCARDAEIGLLIAADLEASGHPPKLDGCAAIVLLRRHARVLERLAANLDPSSSPGRWLGFKRRGAGRRSD